MEPQDARRVLALICEAGTSEGAQHYAKRAKFIKRMKHACDRTLDYAKHETLRKIEKHFRKALTSAEGDPGSVAVRLTFKKKDFSEELLAALREEALLALQAAGQNLFTELGRDDPWAMPGDLALGFLDTRENLLSNVPDEIHADIMRSIEEGLNAGETRKELMSRISTAFDEIKKSRAETIANTETAAAFNYARDKAMREAGVTHKRWLHSQSPLIKEPRPTHVAADGQIVPIDEPFDIGGVPMMRPGDESAGPDEIINCHCVAIPVEAP
jgi:hypothetical protein